MMSKMGRIFDYISRQIELDSRITADEVEQTQLGYQITYDNPVGEASYFTYSQDDKKLFALVKFSWNNDVTIYVKSLEFWSIPRREKLSEFEYTQVLNRISKFASSWGDVYTNDSSLIDSKEIKSELCQASIPFVEHEDGMIEYTSTVEKERSRKDGFFNEK
jgi:hypothetical protein